MPRTGYFDTLRDMVLLDRHPDIETANIELHDAGHGPDTAFASMIGTIRAYLLSTTNIEKHKESFRYSFVSTALI